MIFRPPHMVNVLMIEDLVSFEDQVQEVHQVGNVFAFFLSVVHDLLDKARAFDMFFFI